MPLHSFGGLNLIENPSFSNIMNELMGLWLEKEGFKLSFPKLPSKSLLFTIYYIIYISEGEEMRTLIY